MNKYNFFSKKNFTFPQKMPLDARIAVVTTRKKKFPTKGSLDPNPEKCKSLYILQKKIFSPKTSKHT